MSGPVTADYLDTVAYTTGIPAETLRGLRDRSLVAVPRSRFKEIDGQVITAAHSLSDRQKQQPPWLWFADVVPACVTLGRWQRRPDAAPYVRLDIALAAAQEPPR